MKNKLNHLFSFLILTLAFFNTYSQSQPFSLVSIQNRYKATWPKSITYIEQVHHEQYKKVDDYRVYHAYDFPGIHRIDMGDPDDGNSKIIINDMFHEFRSYKKLAPFLNRNLIEYYILGEIYFDQPEGAKQYFIANGIDMNKTGSGNWEGKKVLIFGAKSIGEQSGVQLYYDAQLLVPLRLVDYRSGRALESRFKIKQYNGYWLLESTRKLLGSKQIEYSIVAEPKTGVKIDPKVFDLENFGSYHWYEKH